MASPFKHGTEQRAQGYLIIDPRIIAIELLMHKSVSVEQRPLRATGASVSGLPSP